MNILITGASGFVGHHLMRKLIEKGHTIHALTRSPERSKSKIALPVTWFKWDPLNELPPQEAFKGIDAVINLIGENIAAKRWSDAQKKRILESRTISTQNLVKAVNQYCPELKSFVSSSAVGYYQRNIGDQEIDEKSQAGDGYLADVCKQWEESTNGLPETVRKVILRIGVVLGREDGALKKLLPIFKLGAGGPIGSGKAWMSWIHVSDLVDLFTESVENQNYNGILNAVSPEPCRNTDFTKAIAKGVNRPAFFPVPPFMLKILFGEMASIILDSQRIYPRQTEALGFKFNYADIYNALEDICNKGKWESLKKKHLPSN